MNKIKLFEKYGAIALTFLMLLLVVFLPYIVGGYIDKETTNPAGLWVLGTFFMLGITATLMLVVLIGLGCWEGALVINDNIIDYLERRNNEL
jgi:hypothetical protein